MYQISVYIPKDFVENVKRNMFTAGAGSIGNYSKCCFEYTGIGQFMAEAGSRPFIGEMGRLEKVSEVKVEMVCEERFLKDSIKALKDSHPYETPAYYVIKLVEI